MNAFHIFEVAEKPLVDLETLKQKLHQLSKEHHPNQESSESGQWHEINTAYQILIDDVSRLKHLLELRGESDLNASAAVPTEVMSLFSTVGPILHRADDTITQIDQAESALEKAMLQEDVMTLGMELQQVAAQVGGYRSRVSQQIESLDAGWQQHLDSDCAELLNLYRQLIYIARWAKQLDEKLFRVMSF